jgi:predicted phage tail protein
MRQYDPPPMVRVRLLGILGRKFGSEWTVAATTPVEVIRAICANCSDFASALLRYSEEGIGYKVFRGKKPSGAILDESELMHPIIHEEMIIAPVPQGSGGLGKVLLGVALLGVGLLTGGSTWLLLGGTMLLQGVIGLFSPQADTPKSDNERDSSFLINSGAQTSRDYDPVPLLYGRRIIQGLPVLSSGVITYEG